MEFDFSEAVKRATGTTFDNAANASNFISNNIRRFNMVLSKKKTEELEKNIFGICYAMNNFGLERKHDVFNIGVIGIKENFDALPQFVQMQRLHNLNSTLNSATTPANGMPIHIRCRKIYKACKRFTSKIKEKEFSDAAAGITSMTIGKTDEAKIRTAFGFALGR